MYFVFYVDTIIIILKYFIFTITKWQQETELFRELERTVRQERFFQTNRSKEPIRRDESDSPLLTGCCHATHAVSVSVCATTGSGAVFKADRGWGGEFCRDYFVPVFSHKSKNRSGFILPGKSSANLQMLLSCQYLSEICDDYIKHVFLGRFCLLLLRA